MEQQALGLGLVWVNIERVDLAYELKSLERELQEKQEQNSKLQVERHYLLAPATLSGRTDRIFMEKKAIPERDDLSLFLAWGLMGHMFLATEQVEDKTEDLFHATPDFGQKPNHEGNEAHEEGQRCVRFRRCRWSR